MIVRVKLFAQYRDLAPGADGVRIVDMPVGVTVREVLDFLKIPADEPKIVLAEGLPVDLDHPLRDGDVLSVLPPVAGG